MFQTVYKVRERKGFTLIELLIVVAIIGILAAIAIPAFLGQQKKAKSRALESGCSGAAKSAGVMLTGASTREPWVLFISPGSKGCWAHRGLTTVDTDANPATAGVPTCMARYRDIYDITASQGRYDLQYQNVAGSTIAQEVALALCAEGCGILTGGTDITAGTACNTAPIAGLGKASPYSPGKCLYKTMASTSTIAVDDTDEGQCVIEFNNAGKSVRVIMVDDDGKTGSHGETKVYAALGSD